MVFIHSTLNSAPMLDSKNRRLTGWLRMTDALVAQFRRPGAHGAGVSRARGSARPQGETLPPSQLLLGAARTPGPVGSWFHSAPLSAHGADLTVLVSSGKVNTLCVGGRATHSSATSP